MAALLAASMVLAGCGNDDGEDASGTTSTSTTSTTAPPPTTTTTEVRAQPFGVSVDAMADRWNSIDQVVVDGGIYTPMVPAKVTDRMFRTELGQGVAVDIVAESPADLIEAVRVSKGFPGAQGETPTQLLASIGAALFPGLAGGPLDAFNEDAVVPLGSVSDSVTELDVGDYYTLRWRYDVGEEEVTWTYTRIGQPTPSELD